LDFIGAKDDGGSGDKMKTLRRDQSNRHRQQTNIQLFTGRMPFVAQPAVKAFPFP